MFSNENFCKKVFEAGLQEVTFSIHGHTPKLHDYLVATPWAFKKALKWIIFIKKNYPNIIINIDIVVNKVNVKFLPEIVRFFIKLWIYEFDILQIIPFGRWFDENKEKLFYNIEENLKYLHTTWELSKIPWMFMWTNRFPSEAFEWYEDLIQDPRKIKWEVLWEWREMFDKFISSKWEMKPDCFWERCNYCFQKQFCNNFLVNTTKLQWKFKKLEWEYFPSEVYSKYGEKRKDFLTYLQENKNLMNVPKCLWWSWIYDTYTDLKPKFTLEDYTKKYIKTLYRKKSLRCRNCKYNNECEWIHINFIRSYGFSILEPII
jgi:MoaA/NifB/PqqE/SkfB family radical SAM enzyme